MRRAVIVIMDSFGIGSAVDANQFGGEGFNDVGSNTLGHIAEAFAQGAGNDTSRSGPLSLPNLNALGLGHSCEKSSGYFPAGLDRDVKFTGGYAYSREVSSGKDTPSGHWEIACSPVLFDWSYFPKVPDCFPAELLRTIEEKTGVVGSLGNCHASGTEIIAKLGEEHMRSGLPIYYTSADSVFQIACHEESFGLDRLLQLCQDVREVLNASDLNIGRVIARPFVGESAATFQRTGNRHDYAVPPPTETIFQRMVCSGGSVIGIGKIGDIYAHTGITEEIRASGHEDLMARTLEVLDRRHDNSIVMTNFVDFDAVWGHRRDVAGYGHALEAFDKALPALLERMEDEDLLILTADHGNDPSWPGTDHTREHVPVLLYGCGVEPGRYYGRRETFADIGETMLKHFNLPAIGTGRSIL
ncbi:MAG: phosphopentomutase [Verrucomicrobiae bacterium]|nr:phosphopentomutase [Verrucomicrobiae bacterium]